MSLERKIKQRTQRRIQRIRAAIRHSGMPRLSVFRSATHIYAQIIDDASHATLASCSSLELENMQGDKKEQAKKVGMELAKRAQTQGIKKVIFDRGRYLYHGRVKSLAEGAREGGMAL